MYKIIQNPNTVTWKLASLLVGFAAMLHAAQEVTQVIVDEDFDAYASTFSMHAVWAGGTGVLDKSPPGGGKAALHDGGELSDYTGFSANPDGTNNLEFSADFYDFGTNVNKRVTVLLKNGSGANLEFGLLNAYGPYCYRTVGFGVSDEWQPFADAPQAVPGWHRFAGIISRSNIVLTLDLGRDGKIDSQIVVAGTPPKRPFNMIRFGGLPGKTSRGGPVYVDNIHLALVAADKVEPVAATPAATIRNIQQQDISSPAPPVVAVAKESAPPAQAAVAVVPAPASDAPWGIAGWGVIVGLVVIIGLLAALILMIRNHGKSVSGALVPAVGGQPARASEADPSEALTPEGWKQRALKAETLADKQAQVLREKMLPELAEFAKQSLVQELYTQRNELLETQKQAQAELAALEQRLEALHLPLQERIRAYESRITELEKDFETRGEEVRELTRATLALVRQRLDEEREKVRIPSRLN